MGRDGGRSGEIGGRAWKPYTRTTAGFDASYATTATSFYKTYHAASNAKPYVETTYTTDALARVKRMTPEFLGTTATAYTQYSYGVAVTPKQRYTEVTDEAGKKRRTYTDVFGFEVKTILGYGATEATTTNLASNVLGQRTQATDPRGLTTSYTLNTRGLLTARTSPGDYSSYVVRHRQGSYRELFTQVVSNPPEPACVPSQFDATNEYEIAVQRLDSIKTAAHTVAFTTTLRTDVLHPMTGAQRERRLAASTAGTAS